VRRLEAERARAAAKRAAKEEADARREAGLAQDRVVSCSVRCRLG
jgi:hypothetical protein